MRQLGSTYGPPPEWSVELPNQQGAPRSSGAAAASSAATEAAAAAAATTAAAPAAAAAAAATAAAGGTEQRIIYTLEHLRMGQSYLISLHARNALGCAGHAPHTPPPGPHSPQHAHAHAHAYPEPNRPYQVGQRFGRARTAPRQHHGAQQAPALLAPLTLILTPSPIPSPNRNPP